MSRLAPRDEGRLLAWWEALGNENHHAEISRLGLGYADVVVAAASFCPNRTGEMGSHPGSSPCGPCQIIAARALHAVLHQ